ncbi:hypothetical protein ABFA07_002257 [Porites harrisoni]
MENRHPKKQVNTLRKRIRRSASNTFQKWRKEPKTSGQSGGVGQAGTSASFDTGSEKKVESVISDDHGTSAGASCLDQGSEKELELRVATDDVEASLGNIHICQSSHVEQVALSKTRVGGMTMEQRVEHQVQGSQFFMKTSHVSHTAVSMLKPAEVN